MKGLGTDIIEIDRIEHILEEYGDRFLIRHFTPREIAYCKSFARPAERFAGRFSAKEAIVKALGTGFSKKTGFLDIEILNDPLGAPKVQVHTLPNERFMLSISHCRLYATATAIWL